MKLPETLHPMMECTDAALHLCRRPAALHLLTGPSHVYTAGLILGVAVRQPVAIIDGAARFNSYTAASIAQLLRLSPAAVLRQLHITRSFTAFQTEAAVTDKLPLFLRRVPCRLILVLGLLDTYYDEQVTPKECHASLGRVLQTLRRICTDGTPVLLADAGVSAPPPGKADLFPLLHAAAGTVMTLDHTTNGTYRIQQENKPPWDATTTRLPSSSDDRKKHGPNSGGAYEKRTRSSSMSSGAPPKSTSPPAHSAQTKSRSKPS